MGRSNGTLSEGDCMSLLLVVESAEAVHVQSNMHCLVLSI